MKRVLIDLFAPFRAPATQQLVPTEESEALRKRQEQAHRDMCHLARCPAHPHIKSVWDGPRG